MLRALLICLSFFVLVLPVAQAQQEMEVISLRARTVDEVLPTLLPLVEPGGALTGMNNQLFLRASRRNREDIKRILAAIDTPARQLVIHVSSSRGEDRSSRGAGVTQGRVIVGNGGTRVEGQAKVWDSTSQRGDQSSQRVMAMEGASAYISVGRSVPVPLRQVVLGPGGAVVSETVVYRDIGSGFYVLPRVNGDRVTLDISQQSATQGHYGPASANTQRVSTTVSGRLGEWMELGGTGRQASASERGSLSISSGEVRDQRSIWLLVEEAQ